MLRSTKATTAQLPDPAPGAADDEAAGRRERVGGQILVRRRLVAFILVVVPVGWAALRAGVADGGVVNHGGLTLVDDLVATVLHPALDPSFLARVLRASLTTVVFATLGTLGALLIGVLGGVLLSTVAWPRRPSWPVRLGRPWLRAVLVGARSIHELVWALLLVSVLGLDPLVAVLAIAVPFGAQTAKVFAEALDGVPAGPLRALRHGGARPFAALAYGLVPGAVPLLLSYSFYRFECAIRSAVLLGVVGVGGLGQELIVSLQSRNWNEVWTLLAAVLVLSAVVDLWSTRVRADMAVASCSDWSSGRTRRRVGPPSGPASGPAPAPAPEAARVAAGSSVARWSVVVAVLGSLAAWWASGVSLAGLGSARTQDLTRQLMAEMWPPALPADGVRPLWEAVLDTMAMAVLAMAFAVLLTVVIGPWATRPPTASADRSPGRSVLRLLLWWVARASLLVLRSIPPTVWAVIALLALFPGILPGALALGLYTAGILGRLIAEAWESIDPRPRDAVRVAGVRRSLASVAATVPPSAHHLITYTLYRFEICVRDTTVVGVVGAAGLGRLLAENLNVFRFPVVTTLLGVSFAVSALTELLGRQLRRASDR